MWCGGFGYGPYAWGAVVSGVVMLLVWGGLIALVIWAVGAFTRRPASGESAMEILRRRFAAGQISQEDFEKIRRLLES